MKKRYNFVAIFIITALVLFFSLKDDFNKIIDIILSVNIYWLMLAIAFIIYFLFLKSYVFYRLVRHHKKDYTLMKAFRTTMNVQFFQSVTPFSTGGQPYEIYTLTKEDIKVTTATNISIQHFILYQTALVILGSIAVTANYFIHFFPGNNLLKKLVLIGFLINTTVIIVLFILSYAKKWNQFLINKVICTLGKYKLIKKPEKTLKSFKKYVVDFHKGADILLKNKKLFFVGVVINMWALTIFYLVPLIILFSLGVYTEMNALTAFVSSAYVMLIGSVVPLPGGSGGLEFSFVEFYSFFVGGKIVIATMIIWRFLTYYLGMILGAISTNIKEVD